MRQMSLDTFNELRASDDMSIHDELIVEKAIRESGVDPSKFAKFYSNHPELLQVRTTDIETMMDRDQEDEFREYFLRKQNHLTIADHVAARFGTLKAAVNALRTMFDNETPDEQEFQKKIDSLF